MAVATAAQLMAHGMPAPLANQLAGATTVNAAFNTNSGTGALTLTAPNITGARHRSISR